ncbi:hypothetical protein D3C72_2409080 [compost metagenome]
MNGGDRDVLEAEGLVEQPQQRHAAVGGAGRVGHQAFRAGQAMLVDTVDHRGIDIRLTGHRLREQHPWRTRVKKALAVCPRVVGT